MEKRLTHGTPRQVLPNAITRHQNKVAQPVQIATSRVNAPRGHPSIPPLFGMDQR
jgi:hypothetical protein